LEYTRFPSALFVDFLTTLVLVFIYCKAENTTRVVTVYCASLNIHQSKRVSWWKLYILSMLVIYISFTMSQFEDEVRFASRKVQFVLD